MRDQNLESQQIDYVALLQQDLAIAAKEQQQKQRPPFGAEREAVGYAIYKARHYKKLTQAQLANEVGVSQATIARVESGKSNPLLTTLLKIAHALDTTIEL